ncbi:hypothetical protein ACJW30_02G102900 [Castanea mollissima]
MASASCGSKRQSPMKETSPYYPSKRSSPMKETSPNYHPYPASLAKYDDVAINPSLFMSTLEKLHASMGTKFMIPIIGGKELDLHRLFVEVTSRGGIEKIIRERRWKEVTAVFNFPSTATNASFVLRKYYASLLHHYEQIYFFKAREWVRSSDSVMSPSMTPVAVQKTETLQRTPEMQAFFQQQRINTAQFPGGIHRRRRRKKHEIKRRDPAHPKPNRSGYNFFFAEQHARLKPLHPGKDREISRMIGELWNKLKESEKAVYQEKAVKDKERYRIEMEDYRERLRSGQVISDAVPLQQRLPGQDVNMEADAKIEENEGEESHLTPDHESSSKSEFEDDKTAEKDSDIEASLEVGVGAESSNVGMETSAEKDFELQKREDDAGDDKAEVGDESEEILGNTESENIKEPVSGDEH